MTRRRFGSIQRRGGSYRISYSAQDGTRRYETVHGTAQDAERRLLELESAHGWTGLTVGALWSEHYHEYIQDRAPRTIRGYESTWKLHVQPRWGSTNVDSLRAVEVQAWLSTLSYGQARNSRALLRSMMNFAVGFGLTDNMVMSARFKMPRRDTAQVRSDAVMDAETLSQVLCAAHGEPWEAGFILSAYGGLRREEAFGVKWEDVEDRDGYVVVNVHRTVQLLDGELLIGGCKTDVSARSVPIVGEPARRLMELRSDGYVMGGGSPANPDSMASRYQRWFSRQPFVYVPWKNLRKSFVTNMHRAGVDFALVSKMAGHSRMDTTYVHYSRPPMEAMVEAARVGTKSTVAWH